jgi:hypothetical protein
VLFPAGAGIFRLQKARPENNVRVFLIGGGRGPNFCFDDSIANKSSPNLLNLPLEQMIQFSF